METTANKSFREYLQNCAELVSDKPLENYYPSDVVADAYNKGFSDGKKDSDSDFLKQLKEKSIDLLFKRAHQMHTVSTSLIEFIKENGFVVNTFNACITPSAMKVIISVPGEQLLNDEFVDKAYTKLFECRKDYHKYMGKVLDISFVSNDSLDTELLKEDGFNYVETYV